MNQKITFPELVELMARRQHCSRREAETFLREMTALMTEVLSTGDSLRINGLGTFKSVKVEARTSVNVQTGEPYVIPSHYKLTFTPVKAVREAVNEPFSSFCVEVLPDDVDIAALQATTEDAEPEEESAEEAPVAVERAYIVETPGINEADNEVVTEEEAVEEPQAIESESETEIMAESAVEVVPEVVAEKLQEIVPEEALTEETFTEEEVDEVRRGERRRGFWMGVGVMATITAVALLSMYLFMMHTPEREITLPQEDVIPVETTTVTEVASPDTIIEKDTLQEVVAVTPIVTDTVRRGIFLTTLSLRHYGHKAFWVYIYEENKAIITNPDNVPIGTVLVIPPAEKYGISATDTVAVKRALDIAKAAAWKR